MPYKNILLIGGTHGNEFTGIKLIKHIQGKPIPGIQPILANEKAVSKKVRFIETDLNRSSGKTKPETYEEKLSKVLQSKIMKADFVIEFHNTTAKNNTCAIVTSRPNSLHFSLAQHFGITKILIMPPGGSLSGLRSQRFFSLEISNTDFQFTDIKYLASKLAGVFKIKPVKSKQVKIYQYANISITKDVIKKIGITLSRLKNFKRFSSKEVELLDLPRSQKFYPIFIGEKAYGKSFGFYIAKIV